MYQEKSFSKLDYCQFLISSQINYTLTHLAEHLKKFSHDTINRYLRGEKLSPRLLFEQVQPLLEPDPEAHLIFELDTVLERASDRTSRRPESSGAAMKRRSSVVSG
jgi:hypothetical protein